MQPVPDSPSTEACPSRPAYAPLRRRLRLPDQLLLPHHGCSILVPFVALTLLCGLIVETEKSREATFLLFPTVSVARSLAAGLSGSVTVTFMVAGNPSLTGPLLQTAVMSQQRRGLRLAHPPRQLHDHVHVSGRAAIERVGEVVERLDETISVVVPVADHRLVGEVAALVRDGHLPVRRLGHGLYGLGATVVVGVVLEHVDRPGGITLTVPLLDGRLVVNGHRRLVVNGHRRLVATATAATLNFDALDSIDRIGVGRVAAWTAADYILLAVLGPDGVIAVATQQLVIVALHPITTS